MKKKKKKQYPSPLQIDIIWGEAPPCVTSPRKQVTYVTYFRFEDGWYSIVLVGGISVTSEMPYHWQCTIAVT